MRSDTLRTEIARLEANEASMRKDLARHLETATKAKATASRKHQHAARTTSATSGRQALSAAEREEKKVVTAEKRIAEITARIAVNSKAQASKKQSLTSAEQSEMRAHERKEDGRRSKEKAHARELARLSHSTVRYVHVREPLPEILRVLYLTSNPVTTERTTTSPDGTVVHEGTTLRTEAEVRLVQQSLRSSKYRDLVETHLRPAASHQDLMDGINDIRPHIVHFSGHGGPGGILMDNGSVGRPEGVELDFELLGRTLAATSEPPSLVVLNACETLDGAEVLLEAVSMVIAMSETISDMAAAVFASQFYAALASAQPVGVAIEQARIKMNAAALDESEAPECVYREGLDIDTLTLVKPEHQRV